MGINGATNGPVNFGEVLPAGWYRCSGANYSWSTSNVNYDMVVRTDDDGNPILDVNGNEILDANIASVILYNDVFCGAANWKATTRWSQTVEEKYAIEVKAPQSVTQYGAIIQEEVHGIQADFDSSGWEDYTAFETSPLGTNYFINRDVNLGEFNTATNVILNRAKTTILGSHSPRRCRLHSRQSRQGG